MKVCVIGLGLIGGSLALDLKSRGFTDYVIGVELNEQNARIAIKKGIVDEVLSLDQAIEKANFIILAIPVNACATILPTILDQISETTIVTDVGSTKQQLLEAIKRHPRRSSFVAAHPMAGTEHSGPGAAIYGLFDNKVAIICDKENSDPDALCIVESMYRILKMPLLYMYAEDHDTHAAYVSHISHISSFVLALSVLEKEKSDSAIFNLASGGFASTVRLAKSSPEMWAPIFEQNKVKILEVMESYIKQLLLWKTHLENSDTEALTQLMRQANGIKKILDQSPS